MGAVVHKEPVILAELSETGEAMVGIDFWLMNAANGRARLETPMVDRLTKPR